jgi:hypothetical protein
MVQLIDIDIKRAQQIMKEYEHVLDTVEPFYKVFMPYAYVPNMFDVVGAYETLTEESFVEIYRVFNDFALFYKCERKYYNSPIVEVW